MTAKRFNRVGGYVYDGDKCISHFEDVAHRDDIVKLLNELHEKNQKLKDGVEEFNQICEYYEGRIKELEERNNRQAKQLDNLYTLIEKQDWKILKGLIQEFQECEEQLQKEWGSYGDVE